MKRLLITTESNSPEDISTSIEVINESEIKQHLTKILTYRLEPFFDGDIDDSFTLTDELDRLYKGELLEFDDDDKYTSSEFIDYNESDEGDITLSGCNWITIIPRTI